MDEAFKQSMALYEDLRKSNPNWKKIYDDYSAFRKDQNQWFRFTEATYDRYMQAAKL
jgi:TRAP-type mannitol/chloroaromatic compound transport system substrate-binding protein